MYGVRRTEYGIYMLRSFGLEVRTGLTTVGLQSGPVRPESVGPVRNPTVENYLFSTNKVDVRSYVSL